ncbi:UNVERIFIED_CONTAM: hypothetical protein RMT77_010262 [Armadillidium vulgare]
MEINKMFRVIIVTLISLFLMANICVGERDEYRDITRLIRRHNRQMLRRRETTENPLVFGNPYNSYNQFYRY